jgi:polygalacturonase
MRRLLLGLFATLAAPAATPVFNILDYGARNDASAPATEAIRSAIRAAKAAGGGTVVIPAGNYTTGPIELVSNLTLHIDAGATVRFPAQRLPFTEGRQQSIEALTPVPLIGGRHLENVAITGRGVLASDNADWMKLMPRQKASGGDPGSANGPNWERLLQLLEVHTPAPRDAYLAAAPELRPSFIRTMDSNNVLIEGIRFAGSPMWTIHLLYSENVTVRDVTIETYPGVHTDGIAVDSSRNVRITNCYIDTGDDGIVIKAGKDADGLRVNRPSENIIITGCTVRRAHGAVTIGSETSGWIRNLTASGLTCNGTQMGVRIKSRRGRGGGVENVRFDGWVMDDVGQAINITNYYLMEGEVRRDAPEPVSRTTPVFRDIAVSNMSIRRARVAINVEGIPEAPVTGLRISNVIASARTGLKAFNTSGLELHNVQINAESGPAFLVRDSHELELDNVTSRILHADVPVVRLDRTPGAIVRNSRAFASTGTFLETGLGETKTIAQEGNVLTTAHRAIAEVKADYWTAAEPPTEAEPVAQSEKLRNDRVVVTEHVLKPGETRDLESSHPVLIVDPSGEVSFADPGRSHLANTGSSELRFRRIEFLGRGSGETWGTTGLSPNYKLLLENRFTRVYAIRIPAHTKEPQHTHKARVVVCLSGATLRHLTPDGREEPSTLTTGEIAWRNGGTHIGQNLGDTDLWVIAIEPK